MAAQANNPILRYPSRASSSQPYANSNGNNNTNNNNNNNNINNNNNGNHHATFAETRTSYSSSVRKRCNCCCLPQNSSPMLFCCGCFRCGGLGPTVTYLDKLLKSRAWKGLMIGFSVFLLFGSPIQHLMFPPANDTVFDILSCTTLAYFIVDIIFRIIAEPNYFNFQFWLPSGMLKKRNGVLLVTETPSRECVMGSFMFWCDFISAGMLLYDISFINPNHYAIVDVYIELGKDGTPMSGFDTMNRLRPVNAEFLLLVTIARCARVARFVRAREVINASNKINWYWIVDVLQGINPILYWKRYLKRRQQAHLNALGIGEDSTSFVQTVADDDRRTSWGVLQIGIMAAVHAQAEAEAREARDSRKTLFNRFKRSLRSLGILESETSLAQRHAAAIKIQRAWRAHLRFDPAASNDGGSLFGDFALGPDTDEVSLTGKGSHHSNRSHERALRKRSALRNFAHMNARTGGRLDRNEIRASFSRPRPTPESRFQSQAGTGRESQVGSDMRERTGQRVAFGILITLVFTVVFTYTDSNTTRPAAMVVLHEQTQYSAFQLDALYAARNSTTPGLFKYEPPEGDVIDFAFPDGKNYATGLRDREKLKVTVVDQNKLTSVGWFTYREERIRSALTEVVATLFIIIIWFFGVTAFAGPVMSLVVVPIERMVRLLGMLMLDPLGYQATARFKKFLIEEDALIKNTRWTKEVLKGMETSFLMSTILRIGSLMKVGFGSAGVEIIRNNLQKGQSKNMLILNSQGSTVSCIFLFCDIRQFTDATESLQEEVFVFTNRIAAVVHSICHSYGGAANKNVGDAFLLSWSLEDGESNKNSTGNRFYSSDNNGPPLKAKANQADKALLSVIKICIALYYDKYYLEPLTDAARNRLTNKLVKRTGPVVQMGFGLHAGRAVQGAIGSQRKIDATYVSEAVERAEFLESSTKQYGLKMLMSGDFHRLLHPNTRRRCRKIDQILLQDNDGDYDDEEREELNGEIMALYTFDMDVEAIHRHPPKSKRMESDAMSESGSVSADASRARSKRADRAPAGSRRNLRRRRSVTRLQLTGSEELFHSGRESGGKEGSAMESNTMGSPSIGGASVSSVHSGDESNNPNFQGPPELVLPTGPALYSHNVWQSPDMKRIRDKYVQSLFFQKFNAGLQAFYGKDWELAKQCFQTVLENFDDGPSKYFMKQIKANKGVPPKDFKEYGLA